MVKAMGPTDFVHYYIPPPPLSRNMCGPPMDDGRRLYTEIRRKRKYICVKIWNLGERRSEQQRTGKKKTPK